MTTRALELAEQGHDIIALSAGEPDFDTPAHIREAAIAAIESGQTRYTPVGGTSALKNAIIAKFRRENRLTFTPAEIIVTSGGKQACFNACQALLEPGDEAIIPAPYWVSYPEMVSLAGADPVIVSTTRQSGFLMTPEQLRAAITPQTRLLIINSPSNPSGAVYARKQLLALGEVLAEHPRVAILSDDIYEHIRWGAGGFATLAAVCPDLRSRVVTINGVSKSYAMTGWRLGYAAGPRELISAMTTLQSQSTTNACSISQAAAIAALSGEQGFLADMRQSFKRRHDLVLKQLRGMPGIECEPGNGAFYLLPEIAGAMHACGYKTDSAFCEALLEARGLALVPGTAFGTPDHVRISYAAAEAVLVEALERLAGFISDQAAANSKG